MSKEKSADGRSLNPLVGNNYKPFIALPLIMLIVSVAILVMQYSSTGEMFRRSIELRGGTLVTIKTAEPVDISALEERISLEFGSVSVRGMRGFGEFGALIEVESGVDSQDVLDAVDMEILDYSFEDVGPSLSNVFWSQTQFAILLAFVLMGIISFLVFRSFVPSIAIIASAFSDIVVTLAVMQIIGIEFSLASLGALLMLIGYSVDTDIMLTTRVLKDGTGSIPERMTTAFKTGITMTLTSIGAVAALLIIPLPQALVEIASVLFIGLSVDIVNTWLMNSVLLRWHCERMGSR